MFLVKLFQMKTKLLNFSLESLEWHDKNHDLQGGSRNYCKKTVEVIIF